MIGNLRQVDFGLCVWSAGVGPSQFIKDLPFPKKVIDLLDEMGWCD